MGAPQYEQAGADIGGTGTTNTIPRWTGPSTLGDSIIIQGSTANAIGIGNAPTTDLAGYKALEVGGLGSGFVNADNDLWITANAKHSGGGWKYAVTASTPSNSIRANAGAIIFNRAGNGTAGNALTWLESARIDSSGNLILNSANTGATIQAAGTSQGIKLQGTAGTNNTDPNVLDFYADGGTANSGGVTWTPELRFGGATTGIAYTTRVGRYTRVGNMIFATCYIALSSKGSATGAATIAGLPTSSNTSGLFSSGSIGYNVGVTYTNMLLVRMNANASAATLTDSSAAGALANVTDANFTNTSELVFSIAYPVT